MFIPFEKKVSEKIRNIETKIKRLQSENLFNRKIFFGNRKPSTEVSVNF